MPSTSTSPRQDKRIMRGEGLSDADSDAAELEHDIGKFNASVRAFLASHHDLPSPAMQHGRYDEAESPGKTGPRGPRAPRRTVELRGDIKSRLSRANRAFVSGDYFGARELVYDVIRINAETHQAWTTLASIFREEGHADKALMSMVYAAHLRPKAAAEWLSCAAFAVDIADDHPDVALSTARLCYSAALSADPANLAARTGRGLIHLRLGLVSLAIADYSTVLASRPLDLDLIRRLAEACVDAKDATSSAQHTSAAIGAYDYFLNHCHGELGDPDGSLNKRLTWDDVGIYSELLASAGRYQEAISKLKQMSRGLLGRRDETYWDEWSRDDREWDADDTRRVEVPQYGATGHGRDAYGPGLPPDIRLRLALYRLHVENTEECLVHLEHVVPIMKSAMGQVAGFPLLAMDLANRLFASRLVSEALTLYHVLCDMPGGGGPAALMQKGRCHLVQQQPREAEECFLAAIEAEPESIPARVELASLYVATREREEALVLITEAMALREREGQAADEVILAGPRTSRLAADRRYRIVSRRWRPRRLVDPAKRRKNELERAQRLSSQYLAVQDLRRQIRAGDAHQIPVWLAAATELIDDFRSSRRLYSWDKYIKLLGLTGKEALRRQGSQASALDAIAEKLTASVQVATTADDDDGHDAPFPAGQDLPTDGEPLVRDYDHDSHRDYQGISFADWLDLFLDQAMYLAMSGQHEESYRVCEAARDCTIFTDSADYSFQICVTWCACAVYAGDEETCVSISRQIMRDHTTWSDPYRLFSLLCKLCQTPGSWYSSGPAQKFILRQIKAMDVVASTHQSHHQHLDVNLLVLYGHILFMSTSYVYALHYFLRARSKDPRNPVVLLSLGLAYIHYGLKRQSVNRQYLLVQGLGFIAEYSEILQEVGRCQEALYCIGRTFQLIGLQRLAAEQYEAARNTPTHHDISSSLSVAPGYNEFTTLVLARNMTAAKDVIRNLIF